ncbi:MAG TPA: alpha/beta hydrolase [Herpetosiphonaceae bacterium]
MPPQLAQTRYGPIEYRREGSGPVVVVLNGGHCSRATRLSHERLAAHGFTVITPSRPGYDSTPASVGRSAQAAADALAALLDTLAIPTAAVIGISAAGPTALAFAQRHPERTVGLVLESAVTLPWSPWIRRLSWLAFGPTERLTWALVRRGLQWVSEGTLRLMLRSLTTRPIRTVMRNLSDRDRRFVIAMLATMQSGQGFLLDVTHRVDSLATIQAPILAMYAPDDRSVPPRHTQYLAREAPHATVVAVPADTHLLWIGPAAAQVWQTRLRFLRTQLSADHAGP